MENKIVKIKEAADIRGVSQNTLRNWEKDGKIQAVRTLGKHRRYNLAELKALVDVQLKPKPDANQILQKIQEALSELRQS